MRVSPWVSVSCVVDCIMKYLCRSMPATPPMLLMLLAVAVPNLPALTPVPTDPRLKIRRLTASTDPVPICRIVKDPRNNDLYYLTLGGTLYRLELQPGEDRSTSRRIAGAQEHGQRSTMGLAIGPEGSVYLVGNETQATNSAYTVATVVRGQPQVGTEERRWSIVARTEPYARSMGAYDHLFNAVEVSPDGRMLYVNSGSRTDHGEIQSTGGQFPDLREDPLTAAIFRIPAQATDLVLPRDLALLKAQGRVFCEGVRNTYDLRFSPTGELFGADNGPDRSVPDELNWLRPGEHYGFPWRMGGAANPQQFPDYEPALDKLLDNRFGAVSEGTYVNDPTFPPAPLHMTEPCANRGPAADSFRDPVDGLLKDAGALGIKLYTFNAHRSPLGLVFDEHQAMAAPYRGGLFVMGWMSGDEQGDSVAGPFLDGGRDLLHLTLHRVGDTYEIETTKLVTSLHDPVDSEVIDNKIYVACFSGEHAIYEITLPPANGVEFGQPEWTLAGLLLPLSVQQTGEYQLQTSRNLADWTTLWTRTLPAGSLVILDESASSAIGTRFYRALRP